LFAVGHPAWRRKAASHRHFAFPESGLRQAGREWFGPDGRSSPPKNKISTGAELVLPIGYYAAAG
jgi:hypothetical protein